MKLYDLTKADINNFDLKNIEQELHQMELELSQQFNNEKDTD
jgi:hypothetical protein